MTLELYLGSYFLVALVFIIFVQVERRQRNVDYSHLQTIVPLLWPAWIVWYVFELIRDKFRGS